MVVGRLSVRVIAYNGHLEETMSSATRDGSLLIMLSLLGVLGAGEAAAEVGSNTLQGIHRIKVVIEEIRGFASSNLCLYRNPRRTNALNLIEPSMIRRVDLLLFCPLPLPPRRI